MGRKAGDKGKRGKRFLGFLGALWLVAACLAGCAVYGESAEGNRTLQVSESVENGGNQECPAEAKTRGTRDEGVKAEEADGSQSEKESGIEAVTEPETSQNAGDFSWDGATDGTIEESGVYTSKEDVALYLYVYGHLPDNYMTKREAEEIGWNSKEGNLWEVAPGRSIGGSRFGNYEGSLPDEKGRKYFECDIDYEGGYRGAKRLIYSNDGLIFYTEDHYNTFEQLYGE